MSPTLAGSLSHPSHPFLPPLLPLSVFFSAAPSLYLWVALAVFDVCCVFKWVCCWRFLCLPLSLCVPLVLPAGLKPQERRHESGSPLSAHTQQAFLWSHMEGIQEVLADVIYKHRDTRASLTTCTLRCVVTCIFCAETPTESQRQAETHTQPHTLACMHVEDSGVCFTAVPWDAAVFWCINHLRLQLAN